MREVKKVGGATLRRGVGFTLIELLVVIAIISLLVSILLPSLNRAKAMAKTTVCLSNLKQIALCNAFYANDHDNSMVASYAQYNITGNGDKWQWGHLLSSYAGEQAGPCSKGYKWSQVFNGCGEFTIVYEWNSGYGCNTTVYTKDDSGAVTARIDNLYFEGQTTGVWHPVECRFIKQGELEVPSQQGWFGDSEAWHMGGGTNQTYDPANLQWPNWDSLTNGGIGFGKDPERHLGSANYAFADGHAQTIGYKTSGYAFYDTSKVQ